jgi:hypothetical protein
MSDSASFSKRVRRKGVFGLFSLHGWENFMIAMLVFAGGFALLAGIATWAVVKLQREEIAASKIEFDRYKLGAEAQVADAKKQGIEAGKTAGNAMLRAAELEKRAEELKAANLALEAQIQPRRLTSEQIKEIGTALSNFAGKKVSVVTYTLDTEAAVLAKQIIPALRSSGILVNDRVAARMPIGAFDGGIIVTGLDIELTHALGRALFDIGKLHASEPIASPVPHAGDGIALDAEILVGVKPPIK